MLITFVLCMHKQRVSATACCSVYYYNICFTSAVCVLSVRVADPRLMYTSHQSLQ